MFASVSQLQERVWCHYSVTNLISLVQRSFYCWLFLQHWLFKGLPLINGGLIDFAEFYQEEEHGSAHQLPRFNGPPGNTWMAYFLDYWHCLKYVKWPNLEGQCHSMKKEEAVRSPYCLCEMNSYSINLIRSLNSCYLKIFHDVIVACLMMSVW